MDIKELVGKRAIRTNPVTYSHGTTDRSYMQEPLFIIKVTDSHIVYKHRHNKDEVSVLPFEWIDNNWIDYDELIKKES